MADLPEPLFSKWGLTSLFERSNGIRAQVNSRFMFRALDLAVLLTCISFVLFSHKILIFHLIFLLLIFGAFYWPFRAFAWRIGVVVVYITTGLAYFSYQGVIPAEELVEIPVMAAMLLAVFAIARQRFQAQEALEDANINLERRVRERTEELEDALRERQLAQQTLQESEERYRHLVQLSFQAVVIHTDSHILYVNPAGIRLIGAPDPESIVGCSIWEFVHPESEERIRASLNWAARVQEGIPLSEEKFLRIDGQVLEAEIVTLPIKYQGQQAFLTVIRDVTARRQAERARVTERIRIARDLHDSLGQNLGYLHLRLDMLAGDPRLASLSEVVRELEQLRVVANEAYLQIRGKLSALMPTYEGVDLAIAIRSMGRVLGRQGGFQIRVVETGKSKQLGSGVRHQILCLCREALTNVAKHANASRVDVQLEWQEHVLSIVIADNGRGFDPDDALSSSYGFHVMEDRIAQVLGSFTVRSSPGQGTTLSFEIPLDE